MMNMQYTYLVWSLLLLLIWLVVFIAQKKTQRVRMMTMSIGTAPLGLSEPLFYPDYWFPPTLFRLGETTGFDIESLIFSFAVGGLASSLFGVSDKFELEPLTEHGKSSKRHRYHKFLLSTPLWLFLILEGLTAWNAIYTASLSLLGGAIATVICRPDLLLQAIKGALIFTGFYFLFFSAMAFSHPDFVPLYWNHANISGIQVIEVPVEELLFAFSLGAMWSAFYEHKQWLHVRLS
tara:strand:+ start:27341 stop:28045 length:705 start_codon:yes stop_codon:yes gene_type:complete